MAQAVQGRARRFTRRPKKWAAKRSETTSTVLGYWVQHFTVYLFSLRVPQVDWNIKFLCANSGHIWGEHDGSFNF